MTPKLLILAGLFVSLAVMCSAQSAPANPTDSFQPPAMELDRNTPSAKPESGQGAIAASPVHGAGASSCSFTIYDSGRNAPVKGIEFTPYAGTATLWVKGSNWGCRWALSEVSSLIQVSPSTSTIQSDDGNVVITIPENTTGRTRTVQLTIADQKITVRQMAMPGGYKATSADPQLFTTHDSGRSASASKPSGTDEFQRQCHRQV